MPVLFAYAALIIAALFASAVRADEIILRDGESLRGKVTEYVDGHLRIELPDGKVVLREIAEVERIAFESPKDGDEGEGPSPALAAIESELAAAIADEREALAAQTRPQALVAMYLDTADPEAEVPNDEVEYRCYSGGGYSGINTVPLRQAWTRRESIRRGPNGTYRIQLDPGPPFKIVNRHVRLKAGEVTNLGRIFLEKQPYEGTASIAGRVLDAAGDPLADVRVTSKWHLDLPNSFRQQLFCFMPWLGE